MASSVEADSASVKSRAAVVMDKYLIHRSIMDEKLTEMQMLAVSMLQEMFTKVSLRQVARMTKRSPTYIHHVISGKTRISPDTFSNLIGCYSEVVEAKDGAE